MKENLNFVRDDLLIIEKWNWEYSDCLDAQLACLEMVRQEPALAIYFFCSHPHCLTLGKGLQKSPGDDFETLLDFDENLRAKVDIPLFDIQRGGGITFHYPGQWIIYPIVNLNRRGRDVYKLMNSILKMAGQVLKEEFEVENLSFEKKLLGLWYGERKLASIGLAVKRFVTYHGMALNISFDQRIKAFLQMVNPCGLPGSTYVDLESITQEKSTFSRFHDSFKKKLISSSKIPF